MFPVKCVRSSPGIGLEIGTHPSWEITLKSEPAKVCSKRLYVYDNSQCALFFNIQIDVCFVRNYQVGTMMPEIKLITTWRGEGQPVEDVVTVKLTGVSEQRSFLMKCTSKTTLPGIFCTV